MKSFLEPFESLVDIESLREALHRHGKIYDITGCADKAHLIFGVGHDVKNKLIVTTDELKARELYEEYRFFEPDTVYFPAKDLLFYQSDIRGNALTRDRMSAIEAIISGNGPEGEEISSYEGSVSDSELTVEEGGEESDSEDETSEEEIEPNADTIITE